MKLPRRLSVPSARTAFAASVPGLANRAAPSTTRVRAEDVGREERMVSLT